MNILDYRKSFLIGTDPKNEVRFWVESRTRIIDGETGRSEDYIQCGSCKGEDTFPKKDFFLKDNYDFLPVFGPEHSIIFRRKAWLNPNYKTCRPIGDLFGGPKHYLIEAGTFHELKTNETIIQATHKFFPIVAQTEIWDDKTNLRAIIEYPIKTLNINIKKNVYQVDTGPVVFPDLSKRYDSYAEGLSLAFVIFNVSDFAEFIIEVPTVINDNCKIYHYSQCLSVTARNRLYALK